MKSAVGIAALALLTVLGPGSAGAQGDAKRGEYLVKAGGCLGCHTEDRKDAVPFAGGRALKTPFGIFYGPNITPHNEAGIGKWAEADLIRALRHGERPDGANYFPAFPYPSFTKIIDADMRDIFAHLRTLAPSSRANQPHDLRFPFGWRFLVTIWKWLFFTPGPYVADAGGSAAVKRGGYLVQALGHCGECHTPRNFLGGPKKSRTLGGGKGPEDKTIPNLTPTGLKRLSDKELQEFLISGLTPDGDEPAEAMKEVIRNTTGQLTPEDLAATIAYLRALPPLAKD